MRIAVAATPEVALPTLEWLLTSNHTLVQVISQPDKPSGRGQQLHSSAVSQWARTKEIPLLTPSTVDDLDDALVGLDLLITIGYGRILPTTTLSIPKHGCINLHFSLLPAYRGAAPVQRAIESGQVQTGVTVFALDAGMDTGPIYTAVAVPIDSRMRSFELLKELSIVGVGAVRDTLRAIENGTPPTPQEGTVSFAPKITRGEAFLDWNTASNDLVNKIRAFYPQPQAWTTFRGQPLNISQAKMVNAEILLKPGELSTHGSQCLIGTSDGAIILERVTPAGKKEMSALDWSRGARFENAEHCG